MTYDDTDQVDKLILENKSLKQEIALQKHLIDEQNKIIKAYIDKLQKEEVLNEEAN